MKNLSQKFTFIVILLSSFALMIAIYYALIIINIDSNNKANEIKTAVIIGVIHFIWWLIFFRIYKKKK